MLPPRSSYLHVPFCARRCGYCNFAVVADRLDLAESYVAAIELELARSGPPQPVDTLYFGGGTPTQLPAELFARACQAVRDQRPPADGYEWTVEGNPADITPELVRLLVDEGVTRLSLGAQSFDASTLKILERDHQPADVSRAVELAQSAGLAVSVDLIFATPRSTMATWLVDLEAAIRLQPNHVSTYGLTYDQGAMFWGRLQRGELAEVDEELQRDMYLAAIDRLSAAGFEHYEVSNFAQPGQRSRHNEAYWSGQGYFAEGPGAARYVSGVRETNHRSTTTYLRRVHAGESPVAEREELTAEQRAHERLVFGLRRLEGIDRAEFAQATRFAIDSLAGETIKRFVELGLLADDGARLKLTRNGLLVSDGIWPELL